MQFHFVSPIFHIIFLTTYKGRNLW